MARRRRKRRDDSRERDASPIARRSLRPSTIVVRSFVEPDLSFVEDRRRFDPEGDYAPARSASRRDQARILDSLTSPIPDPGRAGQLRSIARPKRSASFFNSRSVFQFAVPRKVALCVRRKRRKEVLFAKRRTGKGARTPKRRNYWSEISCSR